MVGILSWRTTVSSGSLANTPSLRWVHGVWNPTTQCCAESVWSYRARKIQIEIDIRDRGVTPRPPFLGQGAHIILVIMLLEPLMCGRTRAHTHTHTHACTHTHFCGACPQALGPVGSPIREASRQQLVGEHTHTPDVALLIVVLEHQLGAHVCRGSCGKSAATAQTLWPKCAATAQTLWQKCKHSTGIHLCSHTSAFVRSQCPGHACGSFKGTTRVGDGDERCEA
eukprot:1150342-Pelagomonas_calceolata.AAC.14